jgi:putative flippase GtrA
MPDAWLRPLRFGLVGVANTAVDFGVFLLLLRLGLWPAPAAAAGFACGTLNSYLLNRNWTFRDAPRRPGWSQFLAFVATSLLGLALSVAIVAALAPAVGAVPAKLVAIGMGFGFNYVCSRMLVFRPA